jgi:hypothetical protein
LPACARDAARLLDHTHALKLSFTVAARQNGPPQIRLIWPGRMDFRPDPVHPGSRPSPEPVEFTSSAHEGWATRGTLCVKALEDHVLAISPVAGDPRTLACMTGNLASTSPVRHGRRW